MSTVRSNLMKREGYTPYCGNMDACDAPRTVFDIDQFACPHCEWRSSFDDKFIKEYKKKWGKSS